MCDGIAGLCGRTIVPRPKWKRYETVVPPAAVEADPSATTASGALPAEGVTVSRATGGGLTPGWYSYAPRSESFTGPTPVFGVAGSSARARPSAAFSGQSGAPEAPSSLAAQPRRGWKAPAAP